MPYYTFECQGCGLRIRFFSSISQKSTPVCDCGEMVEFWEPSNYKPFPAFTTTNVNGRPLEITSLQQIRKLEKESGSRNLVWEPGSWNSKHGEL